MRTIVWVLVVTLATLLLGCGDDEVQESGCADASLVPVFPSPAWTTGATLQAPAGDRAAAIIGETRPTWLAQLERVDGWPRLSDLVVPLSAPASGVDGARVTIYGKHADGWQAYDSPFEASVEADPPSLILRPATALPAGVDEVIVAIEAGAAQGATALPACGADGAALPEYQAARAELPSADGVELAIPMRLASTSGELASLGAALGASPVLVVKAIEARTLASFGDKAPPAQVAALLAPTAAAGLLTLPDYRGDDGVFAIDGSGLPQAQGSTEPGFVVALPAAGSAPYPVVLFQHGGGQDKADFLQLAEPLAAAGFAFVAIDLPAHGDRAASGSGSDLDFLNFDDPLWTRGNFRQAVADHLAVLTGLEALNQALEPVLGVAGALDPDRTFYMGLSLGGISGSITFATAPKLRAGALFVAGAGYSEMVTFGLFSILINDVMQLDAVDATLVLAAAETLLDGADPGAYAQHVEQRAGRPRTALFMQANDETIMSMPANDRLARSFGATLAKPTHHSVAGLSEIELPVADNFSWDGGGETATRVLVHNPMKEVAAAERHGALITLDYAQQMVAHCFATLLSQGSCEVIDTGFAAR